MRAISVRQPWTWAICRGGKDVENRANRRGARAAKAQFNHLGPLLIHASSRWDGDQAFRVVRHYSDVDPGHPGGPRSDTAWYGDGGFVALTRLVGIHIADDCYDPVTGRFCSRWADPDAAHLQLADVRVFHRPVPYKGRLGMWTVDDATVLAQIRRQLG